jgi:thiol-disulfide isomerase/thioredoxin
MKDKVKKYFKEAIVFVFTLMIIMNIISYYRALDLNKESLDIKSFMLIDNTEYLIPDNKKILVHFWATWCPTCKFEASNIEKISKDYEVITVAVQSGSREQIQKYLDDNELTFKVVNDENAVYSKKFNIKLFPTTLIFDKNKELKFSEVGYTSTAGLYSRMILVE